MIFYIFWVPPAGSLDRCKILPGSKEKAVLLSFLFECCKVSDKDAGGRCNIDGATLFAFRQGHFSII